MKRDLGPVINKKQFENILKNIEIAVKEGGKIICGGKKSVNKGLSNGYYIEPTIITNLDANAVLSRNEIFGPVVSVYKVSSVDEAINLANDSDYGLTLLYILKILIEQFGFQKNQSRSCKYKYWNIRK